MTDEPFKMHERIREQCDLAVTYAEDGAYASAARVLRGITAETQAHWERVERELAAFLGKETAAPEPPYPATATDANNAKRAGWRAFFLGAKREECPYPASRGDLHKGFGVGWDEAKATRG